MQRNIVLGLVFAIIIAAFAIVNTNEVPVNYLFGVTSIPLILIILGFTLVGAIMILVFNVVNQYSGYKKIKALKEEVAELQKKLDEYEQEKLEMEKNDFELGKDKSDTVELKLNDVNNELLEANMISTDIDSSSTDIK